MGQTHTHLLGAEHNVRVYALRVQTLAWSMLATATILLNPVLYLFAYWVGVDKSDPTYAAVWANGSYSSLISPEPFHSFFNFWVGVQLTSMAIAFWGDPRYMSHMDWRHYVTDAAFIIVFLAYAVFARCPVTEVPICHDITLGTFCVFVVALVVWAAHIHSSAYLVLNAFVITLFGALFAMATIDNWENRRRALQLMRAAFEYIAIIGVQVAPFLWKLVFWKSFGSES